MIPENFDLALPLPGEQAILQDFFRTQRVAPVNQGDLGGDIGQVQRLLDRGIAATDYSDLLVAIEKPVTGCAGADAPAHKGLFAGQAQVLGRGPGGDDERVAAVAGAALEDKGPDGQVHLLYVVEHQFGIKALHVRLHLLHQLGTLQVGLPTRPVFDLRGRGQLPALLDTRDNHRTQVGPGGVNRRSVAGGTAAEDDQGVVPGVAHMVISRLLLLNAALLTAALPVMGAAYGTLKPDRRQRRDQF